MLRFAANLTLMFTEAPFLERFALAANAGFKAVEFQFPYAFPVDDIAARLHDAKLECVLFNAPPGVVEHGERGIAALPGRESEFATSLEHAINYAQRLRCPLLHVMAGLQQHGASVVTYIENLRRAAPLAASVGVKLLVEPINPIDIPGYLINRTAQALEIIEAVDSVNVGLQFDLYHRQRVEGDLALAIERYMPIAEHIQIAQVPGRHEPDVGEIDYRYVFECIEQTGYLGWIGCEYTPRGSTLDSLSWLTQLCGTE